MLAHPSGAYVANLGRDWEEFYTAKRSSQTRKKERKQLKHLAEHGEVRFVEVQDRDDIAATLATLMSQKSRAFARMGVEDFFARPGYREFFGTIATDPGVRELIHVSRLDVGATTAATSVGLKFRDCYYLILSSYDDGDLSRFGPGRAHLHELLRNAIERGLARFDFTVGDEAYKRDWSDTELALYDHLAAVTLRGWLSWRWHRRSGGPSASSSSLPPVAGLQQSARARGPAEQAVSSLRVAGRAPRPARGLAETQRLRAVRGWVSRNARPNTPSMRATAPPAATK